MIYTTFNPIVPYMVTQVKPSVKRARDLYEAAVDHFGTSHPGECFVCRGGVGGGVGGGYRESLETYVNRLFYSCVYSYLAYECKRGCR